MGGSATPPNSFQDLTWGFRRTNREKPRVYQQVKWDVQFVSEEGAGRVCACKYFIFTSTTEKGRKDGRKVISRKAGRWYQGRIER